MGTWGVKYLYLILFLVKTRVFERQGCPIVGLPTTVRHFNLNVFCGYYVLSNGPNWEDFRIISIFWNIFDQNLGF